MEIKHNTHTLLAGTLFIVFFLAVTTFLSYGMDKQGTTSQKPAATAPEKGSAAKEAGTLSSTSTDKVNQRIVDYIRDAYKIPPTVDLSVAGRGPSKINGLELVTIEVKDGSRSNRQEVYISSDNKFVLVARVFDLSEDPFAENMKKINLAAAPVLGNVAAKVTIVEYSDFQCPFCSQAYHTIENDVMKQYGNKIRLVYKNFPLPSHPWAESAAIAGLCANQQSTNAFWQFYRNFFENQSAITPDNVKAKSMEFATKAEIDTKKFEDCYDKKLTLPQVKADMTEAQSLGISGTPLFIINGYPLPGVQPFSSFQKVIDAELKRNSN